MNLKLIFFGCNGPVITDPDKNKKKTVTSSVPKLQYPAQVQVFLARTSF